MSGIFFIFGDVRDFGISKMSELGDIFIETKDPTNSLLYTNFPVSFVVTGVPKEYFTVCHKEIFPGVIFFLPYTFLFLMIG
ncbi:hypothetical protein YP72344_00150 [Yersinia pseudotuberculosis]|nr:hypothetical protein YP72344_00150 [Yersinia pseudotuberculosis]